MFLAAVAKLRNQTLKKKKKIASQKTAKTKQEKNIMPSGKPNAKGIIDYKTGSMYFLSYLKRRNCCWNSIVFSALNLLKIQCPITDEVYRAHTVNPGERTQSVRFLDYVADFKNITEKFDKL